jgi:hypothetical protein
MNKETIIEFVEHLTRLNYYLATTYRNAVEQNDLAAQEDKVLHALDKLGLPVTVVQAYKDQLSEFQYVRSITDRNSTHGEESYDRVVNKFGLAEIQLFNPEEHSLDEVAEKFELERDDAIWLKAFISVQRLNPTAA